MMRCISEIRICGCTVFGVVVMMSATVRSKNSARHFSIARRMSPSVIRPTTLPSDSATPSPNLPLLTRMMASPKCMSGLMMGISTVRMTSCAVVSNRRPSSPPGWNCAKSCGWKLRFLIRATAKASPIAISAMALLVGARFMGSASWRTLTFRWQVAYLASNDCGLPLMAMMGISICSTNGMKRSSSSVWPEFEMASTTSSLVITPRSP